MYVDKFPSHVGCTMALTNVHSDWKSIASSGCESFILFSFWGVLYVCVDLT